MWTRGEARAESRGCLVHGSGASSQIYEVEIWWLTLSFHSDVGARAPPGVNVAPPLSSCDPVQVPFHLIISFTYFLPPLNKFLLPWFGMSCIRQTHSTNTWLHTSWCHSWFSTKTWSTSMCNTWCQAQISTEQLAMHAFMWFQAWRAGFKDKALLVAACIDQRLMLAFQ